PARTVIVFSSEVGISVSSTIPEPSNKDCSLVLSLIEVITPILSILRTPIALSFIESFDATFCSISSGLFSCS
ncbi:hypothetical protein, partial [Peptoniphilus rhinitidis]|uniref:hypothetical protein n=1 Tax=Peptoniphilus rhinitidis TaxID=1175452 RepID=UPI002915333A